MPLRVPITSFSLKRLAYRDFIPVLIIALSAITLYAWVTNSFVLPRSLLAHWPSLKPITAIGFILLSLASLIPQRFANLLLMLNATFQLLQLTGHILGYSTDYDWLMLSSPATSILMLIAIFESHLFNRTNAELWIIILNLTLFLVSNMVLFLFLEIEDVLHQLPGFKTLSWNTAFLFLAYATYGIYRLIRSRFEAQLLHLKASGIESKEQHFIYLTISLPMLLMTFLTINIWLDISPMKSIIVIALILNSGIPFFISFLVGRNYLNWLELMVESNEVLNVFNEKLASKNVLLRDLTQFVSHNLRGPIVSLTAMFELIKPDFPDNTSTNENLAAYEQSLAKLNLTVDSLAEMLRIIQLDTSKLETCTIRASVLSAFDKSLPVEMTNSVKLNFPDDECLQTLYPKFFLDLLFSDLFSNSIKFRKHSQDLLIDIEARKTSEDYLRIEYRDNGMGIDTKRHQNSLFKPGKLFHRSAVQASGMGLYRMRLATNKLGGSIQLSSQPNEGIQFIIKLPLQLHIEPND